MNRQSLVALSLGAALALTACHKNPPPTTAVQPTNSGTTTPTNPPPPPATNPPPPPATTGNGNGDALITQVTASISEKIHFDYDMSDIMAGDRGRMDAKAALLKKYPSLRIRVTGHADERGSDEYNIALGLRRANSAKDYLVQQGIDPARIEVASLGRQVPIDSSGTDAAFALNRRDEFDIIAGSQSLRGR